MEGALNAAVSGRFCADGETAIHFTVKEILCSKGREFLC